MSSLTELRSQLRELRKSSVAKPISKMRKTDIVLELEGHKKKPAKEVESESEQEAVIPVVKKVAVKKVAVEKPVKAPAKKPVEKKEKEVAEKPKKEKVVKVKEEPKAEPKISIKSAPRKKKGE